MEPLVYIMAILGCGDAGAACTEARTEPAQYRTMAQCRAALPDALARNTDLAFPTIAADCRREGEQIARLSARRPRG